MERYENHTLEASRRRFATKATKKCCAEAAAALARAGDDVALIFAAQTYVDAAADLQAATPETKGDDEIFAEAPDGPPAKKQRKISSYF